MNIEGGKVKVIAKILIVVLLIQPLISKKENKKLQASDFEQGSLCEFV